MRYAMRVFLGSLCLAFGGGLSGCAQFPELDAMQTPGVEDAPYPKLLPLDTLLNGPAPRASEATLVQVEGRLAALRARADRLQQVPADGQDTDSRMARLRQKASALRAQ